jgi:hypothetical protein
MAKTIDIGVEADHLEAQTRASGLNALEELIWNALDADANTIKIFIDKDAIGTINSIEVLDDGHGLEYSKTESIFSRLGGSAKKSKNKSPGNRMFHGKEGKGRYKSLSLGDLVEFESTYKNNGAYCRFSVFLDRNSLKKAKIGDENKTGDFRQSGFHVRITNVDQKKAQFLVRESTIQELQKKFAVYCFAYPTVRILINGQQINFVDSVKDQQTVEIKTKEQDQPHDFQLKIIEWKFESPKSIHLCNTHGVSFFETPLNLRAKSNLSLYLMGEYIEEVQKKNYLTIGLLDETLKKAIELSTEASKEYIRNQLHKDSRLFIEQLKREEVYPYQNEVNGDDRVETTKRQVFDIVALQVNEFIPSFSTQEKKSKRLTLSLLRQALESDGEALRNILNEVIRLPKEKQEDLNEILGKFSFVNIIDTIHEISNRMRTIYEIRELLFNKEISAQVKERIHLHKILIHETWLFGDEYTLGAQDVSLKSVLTSYLKHLGREDFEEVVDGSDNQGLRRIPDVCLYKQYSLGKHGYFENLVVELKRPSQQIRTEELNQIKAYAHAVQNDTRFPKERTRWKFILMSTNIAPDAMFECNQLHRKFGHILEADGLDVFVVKWGDLLNEADARHQYLKEKLGYTISSNEEGISLLDRKYKQYLPDLVEKQINEEEKIPSPQLG